MVWWKLIFFFFFFNDTATTEIYTLSLHDALPISHVTRERFTAGGLRAAIGDSLDRLASPEGLLRSEEHTSELQSQSNLVCRLLLEKKKKNTVNYSRHRTPSTVLYAPR